MQDVFTLVGRDRKTYAEIAAMLGISDKTVASYTASIRDRLGETGKPRDTLVRCYVEMYPRGN